MLCEGGSQMFSLPHFFAVPTGAFAQLDMTAEFAPLFIGMLLLLGLSALGIALSAWGNTPQRMQPATQSAQQTGSLPKAA